MVGEAFTHGESFIHRLDPRARLVVMVAFALVVALSTQPAVQVAALLVGLAVLAAARPDVRATLKRLAAVNSFMVMLIVLLPASTPGSPFFALGPLSFSREGLAKAAAIAARCNAIVFVFTGLVSTIELPTLGHAFRHLRVPDKLSHLFLLAVRYVDLLHREYARLRSSMKARGFKPRACLHTYRTFGYLVGMVLFRSFNRSERVFNAMRCRGFNGRFRVMSHFAAGRNDLYFGIISIAVLLALGYYELLY